MDAASSYARRERMAGDLWFRESVPAVFSEATGGSLSLDHVCSSSATLSTSNSRFVHSVDVAERSCTGRIRTATKTFRDLFGSVVRQEKNETATSSWKMSNRFIGAAADATAVTKSLATLAAVYHKVMLTTPHPGNPWILSLAQGALEHVGSKEISN